MSFVLGYGAAFLRVPNMWYGDSTESLACLRWPPFLSYTWCNISVDIPELLS